MPESVPLRRLRIAVLNRTFSATGGGAERYSIALVEQLAARHELHVFAQQIGHDFPGVHYHRISTPWRQPRWVNQLWYATATWWLTRRGFDVVHSHENTWHGAIQTVHVLPVAYNLFKGREGIWHVLRWVKVISSPRLLTYLGLERARYASDPKRQVVVTSDSLRAIMALAYPQSRGMVSVVTPGINLPLPLKPPHKQSTRSSLGLPREGCCLLFVANDYRKKGLATLLLALVQLPSEVYLVVVGNAAQRTQFQHNALGLGLDQRVFFLGAMTDVVPAYQAADVLVHPTLEDTFAMVVLEAMAHGLPVVVSAAQYCGISGLLTDGENALLLPNPEDATVLAQKLMRLLKDVPLAQRLSQAGVDFAQNYQWEKIAAQQEILYLKAVGAADA